MSRGKHIAAAIILFITYAIGLPLFVIGIQSNGDQVLFTIIGLLLCGLPSGIISFFLGKALYGRKNRRRTKSKDSALTRLAIVLIGLFLGLVITPILIIYHIVKAVKFQKPEPAPAGETEPASLDATEPVQE